MALPRDWAEPFLDQARADLRAAEAAYSARCPSTFAMLLQMTFEKLGKAAIARNGQPPPANHQTASWLLQILERTPGGVHVEGISTHHGKSRIFSAIQEMENAHPAVAAQSVKKGITRQYPQLEFPWENPATGTVEWPEAHLPLAQRIGDPKDRIAADLLVFARALIRHFPYAFSVGNPLGALCGRAPEVIRRSVGHAGLA